MSRRVLWDNGPHFQRLIKPGRSYLVNRGWERLPAPLPEQFLSDHDNPLAFVWPGKSGPQFPVDTVSPALVRPYPASVTQCLDDKLLLAEALKGRDVMPESVKLEDAADGELYFVKHRRGAQGKSVYVKDRSSLLSWSRTCKNVDDFVIQKEVIPALDESGRKFVLRGHILLYKRGDGPLNAALHDDVICITHASPYESSAGANKPAHVSQAGGKKRPAPSRLSELNPSHPAAQLFPEIVRCSEILVKETMNAFASPNAHGVTCFALAGADYLVDRTGKVWLCEVNSHPALNWGSMQDVDRGVFARLVEEMLGVLLFDEALSETGFESLPLG